MREVMGWILAVAGVLVMGLTGLCAVAFLAEPGMGGPTSELLMLVLVFAGLPFVGGVGLILAGRHLIRTKDQT